MANVTRFSPFREIERFSPFREIEEIWKSMQRWPLMGETEVLGTLRLDVMEDESRYVVQADLPGVSKDDIRVSIDGNQVSIAAEVARAEEAHGPGLLRCERFHGRLYRSFTLDSAVDEGTADAKYENGVLELTLPKKAGATTHQLEVH